VAPPGPPAAPGAEDPLAVFRAVRDRTLRDGPDQGVFVAESLHVVRRVIESGLIVERVVVTPHGADRLADVLVAVTGPVHVMAEAELSELAGFPVHRGVLAAVRRPPERSVASVLDGARTVAVLEDLNDQTNLGAIIRSASALGVDGLLLSPRCGDPLYRRTVRVSMGEALVLPWARVARWPDGLAELRSAGFSIVGLTTDAATAVGEWDPGPAPVAVVLGSEADGLSGDARRACDVVVRIAMRPGRDSLNVAAAAAIAFHIFGHPAG
jgi:tRNA G18 (ribose-2'-O)-methylase SpoU